MRSGVADEIAVGQVCRVDVDDRTFAIYRLGDDEYALTEGVCTHGQTHLADGLVSDCTIECPKHNGRFDIRTGEPLRRPVKVPLLTYEAAIVDGRIVSDLVARKATGAEPSGTRGDRADGGRRRPPPSGAADGVDRVMRGDMEANRSAGPRMGDTRPMSEEQNRE